MGQSRGIDHARFGAEAAGMKAPASIAGLKGFRRPRDRILRRLGISPFRDQMPDTDHHAHKGLNNRVQGALRPSRRRKKLLGRHNSPAKLSDLSLLTSR